jgi:hypothetical protein
MDKDAMTPEENKTPSCYQIRLRGLLDAKWADWFDGFTIAYAEGDSILTGAVVDQPALHGMLAKIRDLGLPLVSIVMLNELKEKPGSAGMGSPPNFARFHYSMQPA